MTNKEHTLRFLDKNVNVLIQLIRSCDCSICGELGCRAYCKSSESKNLSCEETITRWLASEHGLPFKFGDIVEVKLGAGTTELMYYVGNELNILYFAKTKGLFEAIKAKGLGAVRKQDLLIFYAESIYGFVEKVGDLNVDN